MEAIRAATAYGGQIMGLGNELGLIREGYLADLLLVDGDPASDVRVLQDKSRLVAIMKDGRFRKAPNGMAAELRRSEEHTSELQSLMRISYAVFCLTKNNKIQKTTPT